VKEGNGLSQCSERCLNPLAMVFRDQTREHFDEPRVLRTRMNVLPAIGREKSSLG
jgi:hypothetical protein